MNNHDLWTARLSDYLDDELSEQESSAVAQHIAECVECRAVLAELRQVISRARTVTDTEPERDLWTRVSWQIRARPRFSFTLPQLVAASLALMLLSGGMVWLARLGGDRTDIPAIGASGGNFDSLLVSPARFTTHYDEAIVDLQETLAEERDKLDPETVRVLEENLKSIDAAIEQCRLALANDPMNPYLSDHLVAAKKRKLGLLRRATAMSMSAGS
jgi:putative zinc finger protein